MKQALIAEDGFTVENVRAMPLDDGGAAVMPVGDPYSGPVLLLADDHYCGVGMVWDGQAERPLFEYPSLIDQQSGGVWAWVKAKLSVAGDI